MKSIFALFLVCLSFFSAPAWATRFKVSNMSCSGAQLWKGSVTVTYTGSEYFNVTEFNLIGMPFTHQAQVVHTSLDSTKIRFELRSLVTGQYFTLTVYEGTNRGRITANNSDMELLCLGNVTVAPF